MPDKYISYENLQRFKRNLDDVLDTKQALLSRAQLDAVNSGVTAAKVSLYDDLQNAAIGTIAISKTVGETSNTLVFTAYSVAGDQLEKTSVELPFGHTVCDMTYAPVPKIITVSLDNGDDFSVALDNLVTYQDLDDFRVSIETELGYNYRSDDVQTNVIHVFEKMGDETYLANVESIKLIIPATADHGFESSVTIKTGDVTPTFEIQNLSAYPVRMMQFGALVDETEFAPATHSAITFLLFNDKINNNILVYEVHD